MFHDVPWPIYANLTRGQAANHASACSWGAQGFLHPSTCWVLVLGIILSTLLWQNRSSKCLLNLHLLSQPPEHIRLLATFSGYIIPAPMDLNDRIGQTTCDSSWAVPNSSKFFRDPLGGNLSAFTILYDVSRIREVPPWIGIEGAQHSPTEPIMAYLQSWSKLSKRSGPKSSCMQLPHLSWQPLRRSLNSGFNMFQHVFQHIPHKYWTWISTVGFKQHKKTHWNHQTVTELGLRQLFS